MPENKIARVTGVYLQKHAKGTKLDLSAWKMVKGITNRTTGGRGGGVFMRS